jgi:tetratricopeptide (TPR) repeat protein
MKCFIAVAVFAAGPAFADCPDAPDHADRIAEILDMAQADTDGRDRQTVHASLWEIWTDAPDEPAQELLDAGMSKRSSYNFAGAVKDFDRLIAYCPDYAEGYNQRAFAYFLAQNYEPALKDLNKAIEITPNHVAALSGKALTLMNLERIDEARDALKAALALNPWLSERALMAKGGPLAPKGEDI